MLFFIDKRIVVVCLIHVGNDIYRLPSKKEQGEKSIHKPFINNS